MAAAFTLTGCGDRDGTGPDLTVASVTLSTSADTLTAIDMTAELTALAFNAAGDELSGVTFEWTSSAPDAVEVSSAGVATAVGPGPATITAARGEAADSVVVEVVQEVAAVAVSPESWSPTWVGARTEFDAEPRDANGHAVSEAGHIVWASLDDGVVAIDTLGAATARSAGETEITATLEGSGDPVPEGRAAVTITDEGSTAIPDGLVYTVYPARWDSFPAVLADGRLTFPGGAYTLPPYTTRRNSEYCCEDVWTEANVAKFQFYGHRIAVLTDVVAGKGNFRVRDHFDEWTDLRIGDAIDFELYEDRIALLYGPDVLRVKDGIDGPWTNVASGVVDFQISGNQIAVVRDDGGFYAKEGISGAWALLAPEGVRQFLLDHDDPRIGLLLDDGRLRFKDGVNGPWTTVASSGVTSFDFDGDLIVAHMEDGRLMGKNGLNAAWVRLAQGGVGYYEVEGNRVALITEDGEFLAKDGLNDPWTTLATGPAARVRLQGNFIAYLSEDGRFGVKVGLDGPWRPEGLTSVGGTVTQMEALVRRPAPPIRITGAEYPTEQAHCVQNSGGAYCYPEIPGTRPIPYYGRFCGAGRPEDADWNQALDFGPMDPMDGICQHHDLADPWYLWDESTGNWCIVNHALWNSRVTDDGRLLALGGHAETDPPRWNDAWQGRMVNLKEAVEVYLGRTSGCNRAAYEASIP